MNEMDAKTIENKILGMAAKISSTYICCVPNHFQEVGTSPILVFFGPGLIHKFRGFDGAVVLELE